MERFKSDTSKDIVKTFKIMCPNLNYLNRKFYIQKFIYLFIYYLPTALFNEIERSSEMILIFYPSINCYDVTSLGVYATDIYHLPHEGKNPNIILNLLLVELQY